MPLSKGDHLGPYEILAPLGAGGMGEVYSARDPRLERTVAIKVLPSHLSDNPELRQRFEREARAVSSLSHPHICTLHDVGRENGVDFLVMEYLDGETLAKRLEQGPLPPDELLGTAGEIADALDKAHREGVVHRDLKPGNIMLTESGAKLLDFGLAKSADVGSGVSDLSASPTLAEPLTAAGSVVGTFQYMAPEQLEGKEADARSDIFSYGALLYEMATGQKAFAGQSQATLIASILKEEPRPIAAFQTMAPPALDHLVRTCLAKDPAQRRQTMHDVLLELNWLAEAGSQAGVPAPVISRRKNREKLAWAVAATLAVATLALGVGHLLRSPVETPSVVHATIPAPEGTVFHLPSSGPGPVQVSPDGSHLAFSARHEDGRVVLWVRSLEDSEARPLTGTEGAVYPFWSPDSRSIGFFGQGKLKTITAAGGPPVAIADASNAKGGSWSDVGVILFTPDHASPIYRVSATGGEARAITEVNAERGENSHRHPRFLPDGRHFLFFSRTGTTNMTGEESGVWIASLDGEEARFLFHTQTQAQFASGNLLWVQDGTLMSRPFDPDRMEFTGDSVPTANRVMHLRGASAGAFAVSDNGVLAYQSGEDTQPAQLVWRDSRGVKLGTLGDLAPQASPDISPDGQRALAVITDSETGTEDIWIYEVSRGIRSRFTFDPAPDINPVWSPEGERVAFASARRGHFDLYLKSFVGTGTEELIFESENEDSPSDWSADGRFLAFQSFDAQTQFDILVLPMNGEQEPTPFVQTSFNETQAKFSPDGRWVAYVSDESGRDEVYVAPFPGPGRKWQVSTSGGVNPAWRSDGKEFYFLSGDSRLMAVEVVSATSRFDVGEPRALFETPRAGALVTLFDVADNGERFLVLVPIEDRSAFSLSLVLNWPAALGR
jgi:serine/threonine protein kinase